MKKPDEDAVELLARADELFSDNTDYGTTVQNAARFLVSTLATWCTIDLVDDQGKIQRVAAAHRDPEKEHLIQIVLEKYPPSPNAKRGVYRVITTGCPILVPDASFEKWSARADNKEHLRLIMELGSNSYMCVPLNARGKTIGSLMLLSDNHVYSERDLQTVEALALKIAQALVIH